MTSTKLTLPARLNPSAMDSRRGVVRLPPEVLDALALRPWDGVLLTGTRRTAALAAPLRSTPATAAAHDALLDDITLSNLGVTEGSAVELERATVRGARKVTVTGSRMARSSLSPTTLRLALTGKLCTAGDAISLLPLDLTPETSADTAAARRRVSAAIGNTWTSELLSVLATEPEGVVAVDRSTVLSWHDTSDEATSEEGAAEAMTEPAAEEPPGDDVPALSELVGAREAVRDLREWLDLAFNHPELLSTLGAAGHLGVLLSGPAGVGKATLVRAVAREERLRLVHIAAAELVTLDSGTAVRRFEQAVSRAREGQRHGLLLITDVDALLPANGRPSAATPLLRLIRTALGTATGEPGGCAVVATTAHPESVDERLREPDLLDRQLRLTMPDAAARTELLNVLLRAIPLEADTDLSRVAERTPGFVASDLVALRRDAALRAALRARGSKEPMLTERDLLDATETVRPAAMSDTEVLRSGDVDLSDVGDVSEVKQALTETVLWPLRHPETFARLGIDPPRGVLLHGAPGGGKTFLVRALAGSGALNVFTVKGAELMNKWVGESERAVRELFQRAEEAAPALVFLDEIDALAPPRGRSGDSGAADRVVAALLTELDGIRPMHAVVVLAATNRPELVDPALLRPGRLERQIEVPLPDTAGRAEILRTSARNTPLAADVDLDALAANLAGYSAADCAALIREAALTAMRESLEATEITPAHLEQARR